MAVTNGTLKLIVLWYKQSWIKILSNSVMSFKLKFLLFFQHSIWSFSFTTPTVLLWVWTWYVLQEKKQKKNSQLTASGISYTQAGLIRFDIWQRLIGQNSNKNGADTKELDLSRVDTPCQIKQGSMEIIEVPLRFSIRYLLVSTCQFASYKY